MAEVRIPVGLDTEAAEAGIGLLKKGMLGAAEYSAGRFRAAMGSVYRGLTQEFVGNINEAADGILATFGTKLQQKLGIAGVTDRVRSKLNATEQAARDLGQGALKMSEEQVKTYIRQLAEYGEGGKREIEGERRVRQLGADIVQEDPDVKGVQQALAVTGVAGAVVDAILRGFDLISNKMNGRFGASSGGR